MDWNVVISIITGLAAVGEKRRGRAEKTKKQHRRRFSR